MKLKEDYKKLQFLLSDESLTLLPEYQQRIQVQVNTVFKSMGSVVLKLVF